MKKGVIIFVLSSVIYFVAGWTLVVWGPLSLNAYVISSSIAGALASSLGLLSLVRPGLTRQDLKSVEMQTLQEIGQLGSEFERITKENEKLTLQKNKTETEIQRLERQKREIDLLVRKASLVILFENQLEDCKNAIQKSITAHPDLQQVIDAYRTAKDKLTALQQEIKTSDDAELLSWILESSRKSMKRAAEAVERKPTTPLDVLVRVAAHMSEKILRF